MEISHDFTALKVCAHEVLKISINNNELQYKWADDWATWAELQNSPELKEVLSRATKAFEKAGKGKGKDKSKRIPMQ